MKKVVCLFIILAVFVCICVGCANQKVPYSNRILEIGSQSYGDVYPLNHNYELSTEPILVQESIHESWKNKEILLFDHLYQLEYTNTKTYPKWGIDTYEYQVCDVEGDMDDVKPYVILDKDTGDLVVVSSFDFAYVPIEGDDNSDEILDKVEQVFHDYVDFSAYELREISDCGSGYMCVWTKQIAQCESDSFVRINLHSNGDIFFFTIRKICDDFPGDYSIPLQEDVVVEEITKKLNDIYNTENTVYVRYDENRRVVTKHQNKKALYLNLGITFKEKGSQDEVREMCKLLLMLE